MTSCQEAPAAPRPADTATDIVTGVTVYDCTPGEAALVRALAPGHGVSPTITAAPASASSADLARGDRCISVSHRTPITEPTLRAFSRVGVRYLSTRSIGLDHVDVRFAERVGIRVEGVGYSPDSVADYTLMLMLMALRHAKSVVCHAAAGDYRAPAICGRELRDLTVGVVGTGRIGTAVLDRLRGFGGRVLTYDRRPRSGGEHVPLDRLLRGSDVVTLHTPLTADTHHLLDRRRIELMTRGAVVVNTGRGALLDNRALAEALERGDLGGAALDVVEGEEGVFHADRHDHPASPGALGSPGSPGGPGLIARLQAMPHVLISPHTAYLTDHALRDMVGNSLAACARFESGTRRG